MGKPVEKHFTVDEILEIKYVKNVSGASLSIHDLSEDGKEGNGVTIAPNQIIELQGVASEAARRRSRGLKRALEGILVSSGFTPQPPSLVVVEGYDDVSVPDKVVLGTTLSKDSPQKANENFFDIARMKQEMKEMEDELESLQSNTKRLEMQASIAFLKNEIDKLEKSASQGLKVNVVEVGAGKTTEL
jgi:hypothetical protein